MPSGSVLLSSILNDPALTSHEKDWILKFREEADKRFSAHGPDLSITMFSIVDAIGLDLTTVAKEGPFMFALWLMLLSYYHDVMTVSQMKYPTFDEFRTTYVGWFDQENLEELDHLWHVANWMNFLFKMITARKNKGLAMQVVPKLVEGWEVKYVTGSGQTKHTANRVHIFEFEGNVKANHRNKFKSSSGSSKKATSSQKKVTLKTSPASQRIANSATTEGDHHYHHALTMPQRKRKSSRHMEKKLNPKRAALGDSTGSSDDSGEEADCYYVYNYSNNTTTESYSNQSDVHYASTNPEGVYLYGNHPTATNAPAALLAFDCDDIEAIAAEQGYDLSDDEEDDEEYEEEQLDVNAPLSALPIAIPPELKCSAAASLLPPAATPDDLNLEVTNVFCEFAISGIAATTKAGTTKTSSSSAMPPATFAKPTGPGIMSPMKNVKVKLERDESEPYLELIRDISTMNFDDGSNTALLTNEREVSWTEIPVFNPATATLSMVNTSEVTTCGISSNGSCSTIATSSTTSIEYETVLPDDVLFSMASPVDPMVAGTNSNGNGNGALGSNMINELFYGYSNSYMNFNVETH